MPRRFLYTGHAIGFSGRIEAPYQELIESQAVSVLPSAGGYSSGSIKGFKSRELLSVASAHTQTSGLFSADSAFETLVTGVIEGMRIADTVKADIIVGRITSKHPGEPPATGPDEPSITAAGSHFGKLIVAGHELTPVIDPHFGIESCCYSQICADMKTNDDLRACFGISAESAQAPPANGFLIGSIVREIQGGGPGVKIDGNVVIIPGFGKLHLGEFVISQYSRRLVMLRVELGSPATGTVSGPDMGGNGIPP